MFAEDEAALLRDEASDPAELERWVRRRVAGEPLETLLGWAAFAGLRVAVAPGVFVPRRRSEVLVDEAVARLRPGGVVVDLCCGSGAVGLAIASRVPVQLFAGDIDPVAVACATRNVAAVGGHAACADLYAALPNGLRADVVVANAPYVPSDELQLMPTEARDHEPRHTLDGGADGLAIARRIVAGAHDWLRPGGAVLIETSQRQATALAAAMTAAGLRADVVRDDDRDATAAVGVVTAP